ncbi:MAG: energy transducer TonB [Bacteroidota bacterium]|nr:energy transducer TonB [Bacteroidota bacterium]
MKIILTSLLLIVFATGFSQSSTQFYFDAAMHPAAKKKAVIFGTGTEDSGLYKLTCYYMKRKHPLACVAHFLDSTQKVHEGWYQYYFDNGITSTEGNYRNGEKDGLWTGYTWEGKIDDSIEFKNGRATIAKGFYYLPENKQTLETIDDVAHNKLYITTYDTHGAVISNEDIPENYTGLYFNTDKECSFPGGMHEWSHFISNAISKHIDELTDADYGTVLLRFVVDTSGNISEVRPLTKKYSRLAMIAFNAIDAGPKWIPAERNGKKVKTIRIQPVTLQNPGR